MRSALASLQASLPRIFILCAGIAGAAGVAGAAAAEHGGRNNLRLAALFLLLHAPALLAVGLGDRERKFAPAALMLTLGLAVFSGDLAARDLLGRALFPMAAPLGGGLLILGWLALAALAAVRR